MKFDLHRLAAVLTSVVLGAAAVPYISPETALAAEPVVISPYNAYQINDGVFEGWGTSLCWWANRVGYSDTLTEKCAEIFYGDSGLRMNIARFNIGGGDDPTHDHITRTDSNMPGYTKYVNGQVTYDWTADANQRNVLFKAKAACQDDFIVEMFSNSPPYYMCKSGCSTGNTDANKNNLKDDCYDDFAEYFATVCDHYQNDWGINITSAAPMNEPYTDYWGAYSKKQEGCHFDIGNSESTCITELDKALTAHGLDNIIISTSDETSIDLCISAYNSLSQAAKSAVGRLNTHTYSGSKRSEIKELALKSGTGLWMSEVDGGSTAGSNNGEMGAALWLAERMATDLNGMNPSAWVLWQVIDNHISSAGYNGKKDSGMPNTNGGFWGLAVADHDKNEVILTKKYYAFGQFSRYIRPGFTMLNASGSNVAAYDPENRELVIVAVNSSGSSKSLSYDLSQFGSTGSSAKVIRTSGSSQSGENWKELSPVSVSGKRLDVSLAANSVTTFVIGDVDFSKPTLSSIPVSASRVTGSEPWKNDSSNGCKNVVDGDLTTFFDGVGNGWVQLDLGECYDLSAIAIAPRSGYAYRCVGATVSVSADGVNWGDAFTIASEPFGGLNYFTDLRNRNGIRYVRYSTPDGAPTYSGNPDSTCCCNIAEIKVFGERAGMDQRIAVTSDMVTGSDPWNKSNDCTKAIDGNTDTFFDGLGGGWVQIELGKYYDIDAVAFCPRKGYEYRCVDAKIEYSSNGKDWIELKTITSPPEFGMNYVPMEQAVLCKYVRYSVPEGAPTNSYNKDNSYCCNIAELAIYGKKAAIIDQGTWKYSISSKPDKLEYVAGESLDLSGGKVTGDKRTQDGTQMDCGVFNMGDTSRFTVKCGEFEQPGEYIVSVCDAKEGTLIGSFTVTVTAAEIVTPGDANCDGNVTIADAAAILQFLGNGDRYPLSDQGRKNADCDGEVGISVSDAVYIQKHIA